MNNQEEEVVKCPNCYGEGVKEIEKWGGELVGDFSAIIVCPICEGKKVIPIEDLEYYS